MSNDSFIQFNVSGHKAVMRELGNAGKYALTTGEMNKIFMKVMQPMLKEAKRNARNIRKRRTQLTKGGKAKSVYTKKGNVSGGYKHKGGRHMAKALKLRRFKSKRFPGVNISIDQSALPTTRNNMRVGHMLERGINYKRNKRERKLFKSTSVWRAYKKYRAGAAKGAERLIIKKMVERFSTSRSVTFTTTRHI